MYIPPSRSRAIVGAVSATDHDDNEYEGGEDTMNAFERLTKLIGIAATPLSPTQEKWVDLTQTFAAKAMQIDPSIDLVWCDQIQKAALEACATLPYEPLFILEVMIARSLSALATGISKDDVLSLARGEYVYLETAVQLADAIRTPESVYRDLVSISKRYTDAL